MSIVIKNIFMINVKFIASKLRLIYIFKELSNIF